MIVRNALRHALRFLAILCLPFSVVAEAASETEREERRHRNHITVFEGVTIAPGSTIQVAETLGFEYEHNLPGARNILSAGVMAELVFFVERELATLAVLALHPIKGLKTGIALGSAMTVRTIYAMERVFLGYDFTINHVTIGPEITVDLVGTHPCYSGGIMLGYGF